MPDTLLIASMGSKVADIVHTMRAASMLDAQYEISTQMLPMTEASSYVEPTSQVGGA